MSIRILSVSIALVALLGLGFLYFFCFPHHKSNLNQDFGSQSDMISYDPVDSPPPLNQENPFELTSSGRGLDRGYVYFINPPESKGVKVSQALNGAMLITGNWSNSSSWLEPGKRFYLESSRTVADGDTLPNPVCAKYKGTYKYIDILTAQNTVHAFMEVSCEPYLNKWKKNHVIDEPEQQEIMVQHTGVPELDTSSVAENEADAAPDTEGSVVPPVDDQATQ
jgi:hypothetical protein